LFVLRAERSQFDGLPIRALRAVRRMVYIEICTRRFTMPQTAKIFTTGRSQAVRLPLEFRFAEKEVFIRRDAATGDVILSRRPESWEGFFALDNGNDVPSDFMNENDRNQSEHVRDPFDDTSA
jgi:antitoxin VapB